MADREFRYLVEQKEWEFTLRTFARGANQKHEVHNLLAHVTDRMSQLMRDAGSPFRTALAVPGTGRDVKFRIFKKPFRTEVPLTLGANAITIKRPSDGVIVVRLDHDQGVMRLVSALADEVAAYARSFGEQVDADQHGVRNESSGQRF